MKLRKPLAILLTLALSLGIVPIAGAAGAVKGQSTIFESAGTVTSEMSLASAEDRLDDIKIETINVTVKNIYNIQVNPYGMAINIPGTSDTSNETIVAAPIIIENRSNAEMEVTATATAIPVGNVVLQDKPPESYLPDQFDDPSLIPKDERVYLYLQMTEKFDSHGDPDWTGKEKKTITKDGGSDPLKVTIETYRDAALQIGGNATLPVDHPWYRTNSFHVIVVLSFTPKQNPGYTVYFDAVDTFWEDGDGLMFPIEILMEGHSTLKFNEGYTSEGYTSSGKLDSGQMVEENQNLTFTIKSADKMTGHIYMISDVTLFREGSSKGESLWHWESPKDKRITSTHTINVANLYPNEKLRVEVLLTDITVN